MNKKIVISILIIILIIIFIFIIKNTEVNTESTESIMKETSQKEETKIQEIKKQTSAVAENEIYEIQKEYDGREVLAVKPEIQFNTVLAGIIKNAEPTKEDVANVELLELKERGMWVSEISRNTFLNILKKCDIKAFDIDDEGYVYKKIDIKNNLEKKLDETINSNILTIIDITGKCYIRDEITGEIVEYPFKDMDKYQVCEKYQTKDKRIVSITTNEVSPNDILTEICY